MIDRFHRVLLTSLVSGLVLSAICLSTFALTGGAGDAIVHVASAATLNAAPDVPTPADPGLGLLGYAALAVAVIGGALRLLDVAIPGLKWLAPRTTTTVDDSALEFAQRAHDRLDVLEALLSKLTVPPGPAELERVKTPERGAVTYGVMFTSLAIFAVLAIVVGCAGLKAEVKSIGNGIVTCAKADLPKIGALELQLNRELIDQLAANGKPDWQALKSDATSAVKAQGLDVAACAFGRLVTEVDDLFSSGASFVATTDPRDVYASFQTENGLVRVDL